MKRAIRVGVTGLLASGKSTLLRMMEARGITVVSTDLVAKALMETDPALRPKLVELLGPETYSDGKLDRAYIASRIFQDAAIRKRVEAIVHPAVTQEVERIFALSEPRKPVAVESALLFQTQFWKIFDYIILVDSPPEVSLERMKSSGRMTEEDARNRLQEQLDEPTDTGRADFTIQNSGPISEFEERCRRMLTLLDVLSLRELPEVPLHGLLPVE